MKDANIDSAAKAAVAGSMVHCGQLCISTERVIVQKEVADALISRIKEIASKLHAVDPLKAGAKLGPVFSIASAENIVNMIKEAVDAGAEILVGDMKHEGAFVQPHVILGAKPGDRLWDRETFGPGMHCFIVALILSGWIGSAAYDVDALNTSDDYCCCRFGRTCD